MQKGYYPFFSFSDKHMKDIITPEITMTTSTPQRDNFDIDYDDDDDDDDGFVVLEYENDFVNS